ncbi:hypothetical protein VXS03_15505 [Photobacterium sp. S4TG1]|nr:hypothetical protein [Photobacterium sp. S4TG1]
MFLLLAAGQLEVEQNRGCNFDLNNKFSDEICYFTLLLIATT